MWAKIKFCKRMIDYRVSLNRVNCDACVKWNILSVFVLSTTARVTGIRCADVLFPIEKNPYETYPPPPKLDRRIYWESIALNVNNSTELPACYRVKCRKQMDLELYYNNVTILRWTELRLKTRYCTKMSNCNKFLFSNNYDPYYEDTCITQISFDFEANLVCTLVLSNIKPRGLWLKKSKHFVPVTAGS